MKKVIISLFAAAALFSCSNDEVVELNQEEISFGDAFIENSTRANDLTYSGSTDLTKFNVYGAVKGHTANYVTIFNGALVTGAVGPNVWSCDEKQYWIDGADYTFAAVTGEGTVATVGTTATESNYGLPLTISYEADETGKKDLLFAEAYATGKASGNGYVNFTFNHLLAKAWFTVTSTTEGGYAYSVKNIKITDAYQKGVYTTDGNYKDGVDNGTWAGSDKGVTLFGDIEAVTATDTDGKTNATQLLLIPTTEDFTVSFDVELKKGDALIDTYNKTVTVSNDLVKGNSYNFKIALSIGELIQFTVTTAPAWGGETGVDLL